MNISLRRRLGILDSIMEYLIKTDYTPDKLCKFESGDDLLTYVGEDVINQMYWNFFSHLNVDSDEWGYLYDSMVDYITDKYGDKLMKYYENNCE